MRYAPTAPIVPRKRAASGAAVGLRVDAERAPGSGALLPWTTCGIEGGITPNARSSFNARVCADTVIESEAELAWELFLSLDGLRERLARLEAELGVRMAGDVIVRALRESR
jgi:hypothetical protein